MSPVFGSEKITRREALHSTLRFSAALGIGALLGPLRSVASTTGGLDLLAFGDWGSGTQDQVDVAQGLRKYIAAQSIQPDALLLLGDNFYGKVEGTSDPRWKHEFEDLYPASLFPGPCYAVLGNHEYDDPPGKEQIELAYPHDHPATRWTIPAKWYSFALPKGQPLVTFLALDSNYERLTEEEKKAQRRWLEAELQKPATTPWQILLGHHPFYSDGPHGDDLLLREALEDLLFKHEVAIYLCGHDHDLQHLQIEGHRTQFLISGGGGMKLYDLKRQDRGPFVQKVFGFLHLHITPQEIESRFIDRNGALLYAFTQQTPRYFPS